MGQCQGRFGENIIYIMCITYMPPAYVLYIYINGCVDIHFMLSHSIKQHTILPCHTAFITEIYIMFWMGATMDIQQNLPAPIYISTISLHTFYMERLNHLGMYNKIHKSSGSI